MSGQLGKILFGSASANIARTLASRSRLSTRLQHGSTTPAGYVILTMQLILSLAGGTKEGGPWIAHMADVPRAVLTS